MKISWEEIEENIGCNFSRLDKNLNSVVYVLTWLQYMGIWQPKDLFKVGGHNSNSF